MYITFSAGVILINVWYDWKLLIIIFLLMWANNIDLGTKKQ